MKKKLSLTLLFSLFAFALCYAQTESPEARAKKKIEPVIKYIDSKITDAAKKLTAAQKKEMTDARIAYEIGSDSIPMIKAEIAKEAEEIKAKAAELNEKVAASDEEAEQINAEKAALAKRSEALKEKQEDLKAMPERLKTTFEEAIKKVLKGDQLKAYNEMLAAQKAKK
jgi:chromosome segregation ATPase